jgi:hypothetical protein
VYIEDTLGDNNTTSLRVDNYGITSDYLSWISHPGQLNVSLSQLDLRGNASISLHSENISLGAKHALDVEELQAPVGTVLRIGNNVVLVAQSEGAGSTAYQVETRASITTSNQYERVTSATYYFSGELTIGTYMIIEPHGSFIAPPTLVLREATLVQRGALSTTQLVMRAYAVAVLADTAHSSGRDRNVHFVSVFVLLTGPSFACRTM